MPPVPRPPEPPISGTPARSLTCFGGYGDRDLTGFLAAVRDVIRYEWDRYRGGPPRELDLQELLLSQIISAMLAGKVVPGFYRDPASGSCFMDWAELACWARWYSRVSPEANRNYVLSRMREGDLMPWLALPNQASQDTSEPDWLGDTSDGNVPWGHCDPATEPTAGCCPAALWDDPRYRVGQGQYPGYGAVTPSSSTSTGVMVALASAAVIGLLAAAYMATTRPSV